MAYIPLADVVGGLGSGFSGASRDIMAIQQARQLEEMRRLQMEQDHAEEARRQAEESRRQAAEAQKTALRPLELATAQYGVRGQILGTVATPEEYDLARGEIDRLGLPSSDLPAPTRSTAWATFKAPEERRVIAPSLPKGWVPPEWLPNQQNILPAPADLPEGPMMAPGIAREDLPAVQRAAERGLPLEKQEKFRDADVASMLRAQELASRGEKYRTQLEYADRNADLAERRFGLQETKDERAARLEREKLAIDREKLRLQKEQAARESKKPTINEGQAKAVLFGQEVAASLGDFKSLLGKGFDPTSTKGSFGVSIAGAEGFAAPLRGLASREAQIWNNASDQLAQAALRFESGAAIGEQEFGKKIRANIPRLGDSKDVVARKLSAIERAAKAFEEYSGKKFSAQPAGASANKIGDVKTFPNGRKAQWDGKGWKAI